MMMKGYAILVYDSGKDEFVEKGRIMWDDEAGKAVVPQELQGMWDGMMKGLDSVPLEQRARECFDLIPLRLMQSTLVTYEEVETEKAG